MLRELWASGLTVHEAEMVREAEQDKYVPGLRWAVILAVLGAPGLLQVERAVAFILLSIVIAITGPSWFFISLKEIKKKFGRFGLLLTRNMLVAFLASLFLVGILSSFGILEGVYLAFQSPTSLTWLDYVRIISLIISTGVIWVIIANVVMAVIKFDANDTMLTGSSDAARRFFERSLSALQNVANVLRQGHELIAANFHIVSALQYYLQYLRILDLPISEELIEKIQLCNDAVRIEQKEFDLLVIPVLQMILEEYQVFVENDYIWKGKYSFLVQMLNKMKENPPPQTLSDSIFAAMFELIADLLEDFGEQLGKTVKIH